MIRLCQQEQSVSNDIVRDIIVGLRRINPFVTKDEKNTFESSVMKKKHRHWSAEMWCGQMSHPSPYSQLVGKGMCGVHQQ